MLIAEGGRFASLFGLGPTRQAQVGTRAIITDEGMLLELQDEGRNKPWPLRNVRSCALDRELLEWLPVLWRLKCSSCPSRVVWVKRDMQGDDLRMLLKS